jgi:hypothetical protein
VTLSPRRCRCLDLKYKQEACLLQVKVYYTPSNVYVIWALRSIIECAQKAPNMKNISAVSLVLTTRLRAAPPMCVLGWQNFKVKENPFILQCGRFVLGSAHTLIGRQKKRILVGQNFLRGGPTTPTRRCGKGGAKIGAA